jgi:hypothetical protein
MPSRFWNVLVWIAAVAYLIRHISFPTLCLRFEGVALAVRFQLASRCATSADPSKDGLSKMEKSTTADRMSKAMAFYRTSVEALAMLMLSAMPAHSGYVLDVGANSCGKWTEARRVHGTPAEGTYTSWIYGYLSAAAASLEGEARSAVFFGMNDKTLIEKANILGPQSIDADAINAWMDNYCRAHPLETIADALRVLLVGLEVKTGYLEEAVCETSDLQEDGRAGCRRAFEATKVATALTLEGRSSASLTLNSGTPHRPRPKAATPVQPTIFQSLTQWLNVAAPEEGPRRDSSAPPP